MPNILNISAVSQTLVKVCFDAPVNDDSNYLNPDHYVFDGGLESLGVVFIKPDTVQIITTPQKTDHFYQLEYKGNA